MATLLIGYDLNKLGQRHAELISLIQRLYPVYWHCLDSTWIVITDRTPVQVRDSLASALDANDELLVAVLSAPAAWRGFDKSCSDWLLANLK